MKNERTGKLTIAMIVMSDQKRKKEELKIKIGNQKLKTKNEKNRRIQLILDDFLRTAKTLDANEFYYLNHTNNRKARYIVVQRFRVIQFSKYDFESFRK